MLIQEWTGGHFLGVLDVKNKGGILGGLWGQKSKKYVGNTSICKENSIF